MGMFYQCVRRTFLCRKRLSMANLFVFLIGFSLLLLFIFGMYSYPRLSLNGSDFNGVRSTFKSVSSKNVRIFRHLQFPNALIMDTYLKRGYEEQILFRKFVTKLISKEDQLINIDFKDASIDKRILQKLTTIKDVEAYYYQSNKNEINKILSLYALQRLTHAAFNAVQNPRKCLSAKKLICDLGNKNNGLGSKLHQIGYCHFVAFSLNRTLFLKNYQVDEGKGSINFFLKRIDQHCKGYRPSPKNAVEIFSPHLWRNTRKIDNSPTTFIYKFSNEWKGNGTLHSSLPGSVPKSMSSILKDLHYNPSLWFASQSIAFLFGHLMPKYRSNLKKTLQVKGFTSPNVGIHVRHTDKLIREAKYISAEEYLKKVDPLINDLPKVNQKRQVPSIFLATDDSSVILSMRNSTLNKGYNLITINQSTSTAASLPHGKRYTYLQMDTTLTDIFLLTNCDAVIVTLSSNLGRLVYELRQALMPGLINEKYRLYNMDTPWFYTTFGYSHQTGQLRGYFHEDCTSRDDSRLWPCKVGDKLTLGKKKYLNAVRKKKYILKTKRNKTQTFIDIRKVVWVNYESEDMDERFEENGLLL